MRELAFICDFCGKREVDFPGRELPQHWFTLGFYFEGKWRDTHHFCTEKCMNSAVKVHSAVKEVKA